MASRRKIILILIDSLGSRFFAENPTRFPFLNAISRNGKCNYDVRAATPGTSLPGRAALLTGRSPRDTGIYGNALFNGTAFRHGGPADVRGNTIAARARLAGLTVASLGFGLVAPDDADVHAAPWWSHMPMAGMTTPKVPANGEGSETLVLHDRIGVTDMVVESIPFTQSAQREAATQLHAHFVGLLADHRMFRLAGAAACGPQPADLILIEFDMTDIIAHFHGFDSEVTRSVFAQADAAVGRLFDQLEHAGRLDDYLVVICGDHGQQPVATAIYPDSLLADRPWASEGATLHVVVNGRPLDGTVLSHFEALGIAPLGTAHLPVEHENGIASFVAAPGTSFEPKPARVPADQITGEPSIISTHGYSPHDPSDRTVCIAHGPGAEDIDIACLSDVAHAIARTLELPQ
ncbi:MAG: alkaline phosphatase family protein [Roseitalea sp.]|jgi:predicted AlkP superfamily pyrophosphatase or phosphodiesterase|nr:alkaline phosphatase family protein [Roseitalea sp.]MBO6721221.1 alkaline phosphatase family protein [Roseitalea sp.]MBO6744279.1 alkaline phosphatase family protein [Roseitalea sp.]